METILLLVDLCKDLTSDAERVDARGHSAVDRHSEEDLAHLIAGDAVGQRPLDVHLQLVGTVECADHREVEHAAGLLRQHLASPARTPAVLGNELLKRFVERIGRRERFLDEISAEHRLADFQTLYERRLIHECSLKVKSSKQKAESKF